MNENDADGDIKQNVMASEDKQPYQAMVGDSANQTRQSNL